MILALILFLFPLAFSPGPGNIFFAASGARFGWRSTLAPNLGYHAATFIVTLGIGLGFASVMTQYPEIFDVIRWLGAGYVLVLAGRFFCADGPGHAPEPKPAGLIDGAALLVLNPKAYVIIALMFSQFNGDAQDTLLIAIVFTLNNCVAFLVWTFLGDTLAARFRSARSGRILNVGFGVLLAGVAVWMALR